MRRFTDRLGTRWDVVVGRESWGANVALFVPVLHDARIRQTVLDASGVEDAAARIDDMPDVELQELLNRSKEKEDQ